jgi:hypothetical protein
MTSILRLTRPLERTKLQLLRPSGGLQRTQRRALSISSTRQAAHDDFLRHNQKYVAEKHEQHADLPVQPAKKLAVGAYTHIARASSRTHADNSCMYGCSYQHACTSGLTGRGCPHHPKRWRSRVRRHTCRCALVSYVSPARMHYVR